MKYACDTCGCIYDPEEGFQDSGIDAGTEFEDIDKDVFLCPLCGSGKDDYSEIGE